METGKFWLVVLQVMIIFASGSVGSKIQLYVDKEYSDFLLEVDLKDECYKVSAGPIATAITEICFIAYTGSDCTGYYTRKFMPGRPLTNISGIHVGSLQPCNATEGGPQLNLDITTQQGSYSPAADILESYFNVCTCLNVPKYVQKMSAWTINNHHNGMYAYFEPDCREQYSMYIAPGHWFDSRRLYEHSINCNGTAMKIQSLGPDKRSTYFRQSCTGNTNANIDNFGVVKALRPFKNPAYGNHAPPTMLTPLSAAFLSSCTTIASFRLLLLELTYW